MKLAEPGRTVTVADRKMKKSAPNHSKAKLPRGRRANPAQGDEHNQATTGDFEREEMGIAPKE